MWAATSRISRLVLAFRWLNGHFLPVPKVNSSCQMNTEVPVCGLIGSDVYGIFMKSHQKAHSATYSCQVKSSIGVSS